MTTTIIETQPDPYAVAVQEVADKYFPDPEIAKLDAEIAEREAQTPIELNSETAPTFVVVKAA